MIRKNITVLVYLHNNRETIEACLDSLFNSKGGTPPRVIVIDDDSTDDSYELIRKYNQIKIIRHEFLGITKSINQLYRFRNA